MIFSIITCFFIRLEEINQKNNYLSTFVDSEFKPSIKVVLNS